MVPSHHALDACPRLSHGFANAEPDAASPHRAKRRKKKLETLPATLPLSELECVQTPAGAGLPVMVPLSIPEIRRLFFYLVGSSPLSTRFRLAWSFFRRTHQAI